MVVVVEAAVAVEVVEAAAVDLVVAFRSPLRMRLPQRPRRQKMRRERPAFQE